LLCTEVPTVDNGGISKDGLTYTFKIRKGSSSMRAASLTPEDVVWSFKRNMIADPNGGPQWMILEALTGEGGTRGKDGKIIPGIFEKIDKAVEAKGDSVVFHLPKPYPPLMGILVYASNSIMDKEWAISKGCWDGNIANAAKYNNPKPGHEPLQRSPTAPAPTSSNPGSPARNSCSSALKVTGAKSPPSSPPSSSM
jgi:peptide/nickel transport system substrate-binding protein